MNRSLEQKNRELERSNDELASFSYVASHDLQEPLRKIQTFSKLIIEKDLAALSEKGKNYLKRIESASQRMQLLIDDLLTFSRTSTYPKNFALADLNILLEEVKRELKDAIDEKNVVIESGSLPVARVIAFQLRQLLENLIFNSIKYSKPKVPPCIQITYDLVPGLSIKIPGVLADKSYHKLSIIDNGIGFNQKYASRIFELFQRLHGKQEYPGTGLGLAICKKIVENHHGFIEAHGEPERGAIFMIYFPSDL
ncbi:MAG: ATP-binding protein [Chitinophagaceae bacterium]